MEQSTIREKNEIKLSGMTQRLLQALSSSAGKSKNPSLLLQNILNIRKDAAYRRLRGEVPFTVEELSIICNKLDICLESIIYGVETGKAIFDLEETLPNQKKHEVFMQRLETHTNIWKSEGNRLTAACSSLPEFIMLRFPKFAQFRFFSNYTNLNIPYCEFEVSKEFTCIQTAYNLAFAKVEYLELILDDNLLAPFIKEIGYFGKMGILSPEEVEELYKELLLMIDVLETTAVSGNIPGTKNITNIYLAHTGIGTEIWLLENKKKNHIAWLSPYPGKSIRTQNKKVCENHRICIDEIKRFSTFITRSGEMERREFFGKLRNPIIQMM